MSGRASPAQSRSGFSSPPSPVSICQSDQATVVGVGGTTPGVAFNGLKGPGDLRRSRPGVGVCGAVLPSLRVGRLGRHLGPSAGRVPRCRPRSRKPFQAVPMQVRQNRRGTAVTAAGSPGKENTGVGGGWALGGPAPGAGRPWGGTTWKERTRSQRARARAGAAAGRSAEAEGGPVPPPRPPPPLRPGRERRDADTRLARPCAAGRGQSRLSAVTSPTELSLGTATPAQMGEGGTSLPLSQLSRLSPWEDVSPAGGSRWTPPVCSRGSTRRFRGEDRLLPAAFGLAWSEGCGVVTSAKV